MNKKIPELLDCDDEIVITDEIRTMFDPEEIKELTMNKIHQNEKRTKHTKLFSMVLVAAVLTAALTVTAFAAYRLVIADAFDGYFGDLTEQQEEFMEQIGTTDMSASTASETTLTPLAVIGDDTRCYIKFRLEAPEGTQLPAEQNDEVGYLQICGDGEGEMYTIIDANGGEIHAVPNDIEWIDTVPGDNVLEFVADFTTGTNRPGNFNDGTSKILTIKGLWWQSPDKEYTKLLDGPWSIDIGFYSGVGEKTLDVDGLPVKSVFEGVVNEDEGRSMTLRSMSISPLTLKYSYDFTTSDPRVIPGPATVQVVMKDGSVVEVLGGQGEWTDSYISEDGIIETPVDLDEVDYIQFGDQQIKVN